MAVGCALSACGGGGGPSDAEFTQACLASPAADQKICECAAHAARSTLSPDLYKVMVLDMQGKKQEEAALTEKMSFDQRAEFGMHQFEILGKCATGQ